MLVREAVRAQWPLEDIYVGEGAEAHVVVRVADWEMRKMVGRGDDEPRLLDLDLAAKLGYERPRKVRYGHGRS